MDPTSAEQQPSTTAPSTTTTAQHRRIDLQSPLDLSYLLNNARSAARTKIDLHLPPISQTQPPPEASSDASSSLPAPDDSMRRAVERSVDRYIEETFEMVKQGINVNGIEGEKVDWQSSGLAGPEEFEPYDHNLAKRITALHGTIETLNLQLATTRREAVGRAAREFEEAFSKKSEEMEVELKRQEDVAARAALEDADANAIQLGFEGREEDVRRVWEDALRGVRALESGLGESRTRAAGAKQVVDYLEGR